MSHYPWFYAEAFVPLPVAEALALVGLVMEAVNLKHRLGLVAIPVGDGGMNK